MNDIAIPAFVLEAFGISPKAVCVPIGSGHIHQTYRVQDKKKYVLQRVNKNVFTKPEVITTNNRIAANYLAKNFPEYLFPTSLVSNNGKELVYDSEGFPWRVYSLIENTITIDCVSSEKEAFEAASGFGRLTRYLNEIDCLLFNPTLDRFHDLGWRYQQFEAELAAASGPTKEQVAEETKLASNFKYLVDEYNQLIRTGSLKQRITHNDTKINNILFDTNSRKAVCVIDLDTLMPGYFVYDLGDMVRTCVSPVSEEEQDVSKITFRKEIYDALLDGYLSEMKASMTSDELKAIPFAGKMMTYIMALRFLADYLRGNTYYHITYPDQNKVRARNQLCLLRILAETVK